MAKRFTDSKKWHDPWLLNLPLKLKFLWIYILDECDHAGFWKINMPLVSFHAGEKITEEEMFTYFEDRIKKCGRDKIWIKKFIEYQYGKELNPASKIHNSVIKLLEENEISLKEYSNPLESVMDKDKNKDIDKDKELILESEFRKVEEFTDWPKQKRCLKSFIKKCGLKNIDPIDFMNKFRELQKNDKTFRDLPFSPSILSSWFDSIWKKIDNAKQEDYKCPVCGNGRIKEYGKLVCKICNTS